MFKCIRLSLSLSLSRFRKIFNSTYKYAERSIDAHMIFNVLWIKVPMCVALSFCIPANRRLRIDFPSAPKSPERHAPLPHFDSIVWRLQSRRVTAQGQSYANCQPKDERGRTWRGKGGTRSAYSRVPGDDRSMYIPARLGQGLWTCTVGTVMHRCRWIVLHKFMTGECETRAHMHAPQDEDESSWRAGGRGPRASHATGRR